MPIAVLPAHLCWLGISQSSTIRLSSAMDDNHKIARALILVSPKIPAFWLFSHRKTSLVLSPLTSDFFIKGNVTPWFNSQNSAIPASSLGSWPPNWEREVESEYIFFYRESFNYLVRRKPEYDEIPIFVFIVQGLKTWAKGWVQDDTEDIWTGRPVYWGVKPL